MSRREAVLSALLDALRARLTATVRRNEALPERVPAEGPVILRDGDPGEPDVTLNPRTEYLSHRVELELLRTHGLVGSMRRRGNPRNNSKAESLAKALKVEAVCLKAREACEDVAADVPGLGDEVHSARKAALRPRLS